MAEQTLVDELRRLAQVPNEAPYTDEELGSRLDASSANVKAVAAAIWREKASSYAELVDVKEGSSDRKLSQLHKQALDMANALTPAEEVAASSRRPARSRQIVRP